METVRDIFAVIGADVTLLIVIGVILCVTGVVECKFEDSSED